MRKSLLIVCILLFSLYCVSAVEIIEDSLSENITNEVKELIENTKFID